jgi:hypothetical protein
MQSYCGSEMSAVDDTSDLVHHDAAFQILCMTV